MPNYYEEKISSSDIKSVILSRTEEVLDGLINDKSTNFLSYANMNITIENGSVIIETNTRGTTKTPFRSYEERIDKK